MMKEAAESFAASCPDTRVNENQDNVCASHPSLGEQGSATIRVALAVFLIRRHTLIDEVEMGAWVWRAPIGGNFQIDWFVLEQRQLDHAGNAASAVSGGQFRGFPVEEPLARTKIEERKLG